MTDVEIGARFVQLADAVTKVADSQLALQSLTGRMAEVVLEVRQEVRELRQRQAESDQRFEVLLGEIRYLIRNQGGGHE